MFYVAKLYSFSNPSIVETFENGELAEQYANIMNASNKGTYVVLVPFQSNEKK